MRPIDGEKIRNDIALYLAENAYLNDTALDALKMVAKWLNEAPTITADDYFDAVDRIKPCPKCRYTLFGELTEDEPRWIPVTERLPEPCVSVLVQMPGEKPFPTVREGYISTNGTWVSGYLKRKLDEVTHWMPMPEGPKEDEGESNGKV